ncbi:MAG: N-acetyltransferase [Bacteroidales bacterium]|nr:N-acetyltransferase [Bacteroidales bacterium]
MIRKATYKDLPFLMEIFQKAKGIMRSSGNMHQWNDNYPSENIVRSDIDADNCIVLCKEDRIIATMAFIPGPDPTYANIEGKWLNDVPYHVIHRIAAIEPGHKAAETLFDWAFTQTECIRIDTHKDNVIMHHILNRYGFTHCGTIYLESGDPREAYQK